MPGLRPDRGAHLPHLVFGGILCPPVGVFAALGVAVRPAVATRRSKGEGAEGHLLVRLWAGRSFWENGTVHGHGRT